MTPAARNLYALAERLGVFVCDIKQRMPMQEFFGWLSYYAEQQPAPVEPEKVATDEDLLRFFGEHPTKHNTRKVDSR